MAGFVQIIEFKTSRIKEIEELGRPSRTEGSTPATFRRTWKRRDGGTVRWTRHLPQSGCHVGGRRRRRGQRLGAGHRLLKVPFRSGAEAGTRVVVDLSQLASAATVGGKALKPGRLAAADFPVRLFLPAHSRLPEGRAHGNGRHRRPPGRGGAEPPEGDRGLKDEERAGLAHCDREMMAAWPVPPTSSPPFAVRMPQRTTGQWRCVLLQPPKTCRLPASPGSRTPSWTWLEPTPSSWTSGAAGSPPGPTGQWALAVGPEGNRRRPPSAVRRRTPAAARSAPSAL
ncbi:hypothetical protein QFZ33_001356 [Arthrobacter globiformis]|nr:hypothetical protein [Arthrobacter globiformis]